ncbi:MAG: diguanylate cyclase [Gammaproteobacteria bacterium]|nr:diguanylate cyclase [Gammaproteobacteria bacterium]MCI0590996.1 diguanylate cyclase [Gammaproteobacteria bacterium]
MTKKFEDDRWLATFPNANPNPVLSCDQDGTVTYMNPATQRLVAGLRIDGVEDILPKKHREVVHTCLKEKAACLVETTIRSQIIAWSYYPIPKEKTVHIYAQDITKRKQSELALREQFKYFRLLQRIASAANEASDVDKAIQVCLDEVCALTNWPVGHACVLAEDGTGDLVPTKLWHLDRPKEFETFRWVTEMTRSPPGVGLAGRVLVSGQPAWVIDVTKDPNFSRTKLAQHIGVKAGFGFPVLVGKEVKAVLEFFSGEAAEPDKPLLEAMAHVGTQLGRVIERKRAEDELRKTHEELEQHNLEMALLSEMTDHFQVCQTLKETHPVVAQYAQKLFPGTSGALCMFNESRSVLETVVDWGQSSKSEQVFTQNDCWALKQGKPHLVEDAAHGLNCTHVSERPPAGYLCVPMIAHGDILGMLYVQFAQQASSEASKADKQIQESLRRLAVTTAEHLALALASINLRESLHFQSAHDPLTNLFNRRYMEGSLEREACRVKRHGTQLGIMMIDVDLFKQYNDTFGHEAGDIVLQSIGALLQKNTRGEDIACRYGGEEFVVIMPDVPLDVLARRAEQFRNAAKLIKLDYKGQSLGVITISVGAAIFPKHGSTPESVLHAADEALYRAKAEGRDRVVIAQTPGSGTAVANAKVTSLKKG